MGRSPAFLLLFVLWCAGVAGYSIDISDGTGIDFLAEGTFNVNGFSYCGCATNVPTLPDPSDLLDASTGNIQLNTILNCATSFDPTFCRSEEFPSLHINIVTDSFEDAVGMCEDEGDSCACEAGLPQPGTEVGITDNLILNFFIPDFCEGTCFPSTPTVFHDGDASAARLNINDYQIFSPFTVSATLTLDEADGTLTSPSTSESGTSITCSGTPTAVKNCIAAVQYAPDESSTEERTRSVTISVITDGVMEAENSVCADTVTITIAAVEPDGPQDLDVATSTTIASDVQVANFTCLPGVTLTIADGVTVEVIGDAIIGCTVTGPGALVLLGTIACAGGTIGVPTSIPNEFIHLIETCSITAVLTCTGTDCTFGVASGTLNVGEAPVNFDNWVITGGDFRLTNTLTVPSSSLFICEGTISGLSSTRSLNIDSTAVFGDAASPTPSRCTLSGNGDVVLNDSTQIVGLEGVSSPQVLANAAVELCPNMNSCAGLTGSGRITFADGAGVLLGPATGNNKLRTQQQTAINILWFVVLEENSILSLTESANAILSGGCDLSGIFDLSPNSVLSLNTAGTTTNQQCTIQNTAMTQDSSGGTIEVSDNGAVAIPCGPSGQSFEFYIQIDVDVGAIVVFAAEGDCTFREAVNIGSLSTAMVGPYDITLAQGGSTGDGANIVLIFESNSANFGQIIIPNGQTLDAPTQNGQGTMLSFNNAQNLDASTLVGAVIVFIDGEIVGVITPESAQMTIGSGNDAVTVVQTAAGVTTQGVLSTTNTQTDGGQTATDTTNNNNNQGTGGTATTTTPSAPPSAPASNPSVVISEDDGGNAGLIGGLAGGLGGGAVLCCLCIGGAIAAFMLSRRGDEPFKEQPGEMIYANGMNGPFPGPPPMSGIQGLPPTPTGGIPGIIPV